MALLAEVDSRRLYLGQGYPSLFGWCTGALHLSEPAVYSRITAARAARRYPMIFTQLADGDVTLTTVTLLAAHLTDENHEALIEAARHKSKRDVERLVASLVPQPDIASSLRRMPSAPGLKSARVVVDETAAAPPITTTQPRQMRLRARNCNRRVPRRRNGRTGDGPCRPRRRAPSCSRWPRIGTCSGSP